MNDEQARRLLRRFGPPGYDAASGTFRPWHRLARCPVEVRRDAALSHFWPTRIVVANGPRTSAHELVHSLHHEAAHASLLPLDIALLAGLVLPLGAGGLLPLLLGALAWQLLWRELAADLVAMLRLGPRNVWKGYWRERVPRPTREARPGPGRSHPPG